LQVDTNIKKAVYIKYAINIESKVPHNITAMLTNRLPTKRGKLHFLIFKYPTCFYCPSKGVQERMNQLIEKKGNSFAIIYAKELSCLLKGITG
jgi:thioredoxin-related protein